MKKKNDDNGNSLIEKDIDTNGNDVSSIRDNGKETIEDERVQYQQNFSEIEKDLQVIEKSSDLKQVLDHLYKHGNILELSDLSQNEINQFAILFTYATNYGFKELRQLILNNLQLRVSKTRKGRDESVKIANAQLAQSLELMKSQYEIDKRIKKG